MCRGRKLCGWNYDWECWVLTTKQLRNRKTAKVATLYWRHSCTVPRLPSFVWYCIPSEVKFHIFILLKCRQEKLIRKICFRFRLEQHEDLVKQIKRILSYTLKNIQVNLRKTSKNRRLKFYMLSGIGKLLITIRSLESAQCSDVHSWVLTLLLLPLIVGTNSWTAWGSQ